MSKKDFEALAGVARASQPHLEGYAFFGLVARLAEFCKERNSRFDTTKFWDACYKPLHGK